MARRPDKIPKPRMSSSRACVLAGIPTSTAHRWEMKLKLSKELRRFPKDRASHRKISEEISHLALCFASYEFLHFRGLPIRKIQEFIKHVAGKDVSAAWVSVFLRKNGWSSQTARLKSHREIGSDVIVKSRNFAKKVRGYIQAGLPIVSLDEIAVWIRRSQLRSFAPRGR